MTPEPVPTAPTVRVADPATAHPQQAVRPVRPSGRGARRRLRVMAEDHDADLGPLLIAVYIRVSLAREEMISPELQQRDVDAYLARMETLTGRPCRLVLVVQDLDISGRSFAREGIQRLMEMMRDGEITTILTYRYDRFGRNLQQALAHLEEVEALGGQVISVTEPFDASTAIGHFMRSNTLAMAELQSRQIGEVWRRVHQFRVDRGLPPDGRDRYGYLTHRATQQRGDGAWRLCPQGCGVGECTTGFAPDPVTGSGVQRIYRAYIGGKGFQAIAHALNSEGLACPGVVAAQRSGNAARIKKTATAVWTANSVIDVADSGFAAGLITHNGRWHPGAHQPLITQDEWSAYQRRRDAQRLVPTKARSPRWSLAGIAVCGGCGGPMYCTSSDKGEQYALYCGTARVSGTCKGTYRTRAAVEAAVALWLQGYARQLEEATRTALAELPVQRQDPHAAERRRLTKVLGNAEAKKTRLLDAYTDGALELAEYKRRRDDVQLQCDQATERLAQLAEPQAQAPTAATVTTFAEMWPTLPVDARRDVCTTLLTAVRVHPDKSVELLPRWAEPLTITFTKRGTLPALRDNAGDQ
jgi:site-specific DNA recombinase